MADETKSKQETPPSEKDQAAVGINEGTILSLANLVKSMAAEEVVSLFGATLGEKIVKARKDVDRSDAIKSAVDAVAPAKPQDLSLEQKAEIFRCKMFRAVGRPDLAVPDAKLDADGIITQALTPTTGTAGAYTIGEDFRAELEKKPGVPQIIWPRIKKTPATSRTVKKPRVTTYITVNRGSSANVNSATTATEITETVPVFGQLEWNLEDFDARMPIKLDLLEESPIDVYQELIDLCRDAFDVEHERMPLIGQGHNHEEPEGLLMGVSGITTVAISAAPTVSNILDFASEIPARYRGNAVLVMNSDTLFAVAAVLAQNVRAAQYLVGKLPEMLESEYVVEGKILGGDLSRYEVQYIRLFQVVSSIAAERKTQEVVVTESWTGKAVQTDAFRIATGVTYG